MDDFLNEELGSDAATSTGGAAGSYDDGDEEQTLVTKEGLKKLKEDVAGFVQSSTKR